METILIQLARIQYHFGSDEVIEIWGKEKYKDMGLKWVKSEYNLLNFFISLDSDNREVFLEYILGKTKAGD